ncbi:MAG: right-handed parallel beta-helix repeat-containing protein, partial [Planctomycetes bacterium]|nr:right-handed parallel beta-helix repeat-containing protein [Planctomycetota bacterium]
READSALRKWIREIERGAYAQHDGLTVGDVLERWLRAVAANVAPKTYVRYEQIVRNDLIPALGDRELAKLTPSDVQALHADALAKGHLAKRTIHDRGHGHPHSETCEIAVVRRSEPRQRDKVQSRSQRNPEEGAQQPDLALAPANHTRKKRENRDPTDPRRSGETHNRRGIAECRQARAQDVTDLNGDQRVLSGVVDMGAYEGPNQALVLSAESVVVPEEGSAPFTVALLIDPLGPVDVTVQHHSGDADISVMSGEVLAFDSGNFDVPQTVVLAAAADDDFEPGTAHLLVAGPGLYPSGVTAREGDDEPPPAALLVDAGAPPGGDGLTWGTAFDDLQSALAYMKKLNGTIAEVWVAGGAYSPSRPFLGSLATFQLLNGTALYGGFAGNETDRDQRDADANVTILSGDTAGDDDLPVSNSSCCSEHPGPGCDDTDCAAAVCAVDPSCCETTWSEYCASITSGFCLCGDLCGHDCDNSYHVVTGSGTGTTTVIDGFTVTAGNAVGVEPFENGGGMYNAPGNPTVNDCRFESNTGLQGGGMSNIGSSPTLTDCIFLLNDATLGGAMYNRDSSPTVTDCQFIENQARTGGAIHSFQSGSVLTRCAFIENTAMAFNTGKGGAIDDVSSNSVIQDCRFTGNLADSQGGACSIGSSTTQISNCLFESNGALSRGGALKVNGGVLVMSRCRFISNFALGRGGAVSIRSGAALTQINCAFYENSAENAGAFYIGNDSVAEMVNCVFDGNLAWGIPSFGGAIYVWTSSILTLTNCTLAHNIADRGGVLYSAAVNTLTLTNSILWDNGGDPINVQNGVPTTNYNCIEGFGPPLVGVGNIAFDPLFVDPDGADDIVGTEDDDLRLHECSPAINVGDNAGIPVGVATDLDGNPRIVEGTVGLGAYEYQMPPCVSPDADGDGVCDDCDVCPGADDHIDEDGNGVPDGCDIESPAAAGPPHDILKNRYISIDPRGAGGINPDAHHIRVMIDSTQVNGLIGSGPWWATAPVNGQAPSPATCISVLSPDKPATEPDWSGCPVLHLTGCPIVPTTTYAIAVEAGGILSVEGLFNTQAKPGSKWMGDVVGGFSGPAGIPPNVWAAPNGTVNIDDAVAAIKTFIDPNAVNATHLSVTDIHPVLNGVQMTLLVNINDALIIIAGFQGKTYGQVASPFPGDEIPDLTQCP